MRIESRALLAVLSCLALTATAPLQAQQQTLRAGYVVCEAPGQLSAFMEPDVFFQEEEPPAKTRVYPDGHPDKKADMMVDGRFRTVTKGRKALAEGWCQKTADVQAPVTSVNSCGEYVPAIPNGGCREVELSGSDESWYTFGDALQAL